MNSALYANYLNILKQELIPALGCTEPIAIAYAAAKAHQVLGEFPDSVNMSLSGNIIKNVKGVTVPNSGGLKGIDVAAILGIVGGNADKALEVLSEITEDDIARTRELVKQHVCSCSLVEGVDNLYITAKVIKGDHFASVTIEHQHTNITRIEKDGEVILDNPYQAECKTVIDKSKLTVKDILDFADQVRIEDVQPIIDRQIKLNSAIAQEGLDNNYGAQIGKTLMHVWGKSVTTRACARAAAGSDARMGGCSMPVVINSGSGNQGMTVSLPVIVFADEWEVSHEKLCRSLVVSNLIAIHQKYYIGSLSAYCGAVSAGAGAGAGIAYLCGGGFKEIAHTVVNSLAIVSGIVCDGAKASCAAKIASSVEAGILGYNMYIRGQQFYGGDGIVTKGVEETLQNVGRLGKEGMKETNEEIIKIMIGE